MPDFPTLILFATASLVLTVTPGPDMLLIASRSISQGRLAGLCTYFGIAVGTYCHAVAAGLGLSQILLTTPVAYEAIRWIGCMYLLFLAYKTLRSEQSAFAPSAGLRQLSTKRVFVEGLATNLFNPKMALFVLALFPQFTEPTKGSLLFQMVLLASVLNGVGFIVNGTVIVLVSHVRGRLSAMGRFKKLPKYLLASVFTGLACRLALGSRD